MHDIRKQLYAMPIAQAGALPSLGPRCLWVNWLCCASTACYLRASHGLRRAFHSSFHLMSSTSPSTRPSSSSSSLAVITPSAAGHVPYLTPDCLTHIYARFPVVHLSVPFSDIEHYALDQMHKVHVSFIIFTSFSAVFNHRWIFFASTPLMQFLNHPRERVNIIITHRPVMTHARGTLAWQDPQHVCNLIEGVLKPDDFVSPLDAIPSHAGGNRSSLALSRNKQARQTVVFNENCLAGIVGRDEKSVKFSIDALPEGCRGVYIDVGSQALLIFTLNCLRDASFPRIVADGLAGPRRILHLIQHGANLIETGYAEMLTRMGYFSSFQTSLVLNFEKTPVQMSVRDKTYQTSKIPLVEGCTCFACTFHTRAYIRHLVETKEMLGETLLMSHNHYHLMCFIETAQAAKDQGRFEQWASEWNTWHS